MPDTRVGLSKGYPTTAIPKTQKPSQRKGIQSQKTKFVRSVVREVAGFSAYERRVMELLRNSKVCGRIVYSCDIALIVHGMIGQEGS